MPDLSLSLSLSLARSLALSFSLARSLPLVLHSLRSMADMRHAHRVSNLVKNGKDYLAVQDYLAQVYRKLLSASASRAPRTPIRAVSNDVERIHAFSSTRRGWSTGRCPSCAIWTTCLPR